jgi:hypothetical protein
MSKLFPMAMILMAVALIVVVAFQIVDLRAFGVL